MGKGDGVIFCCVEILGVEAAQKERRREWEGCEEHDVRRGE